MRKRSVMAATLICLAAGLSASALLLASGARAEEPMVYDPDLGETVPVELQQGLRDADVFASAPDEDGSEVNSAPTDDPDPAAYSAGFATVDGEGSTPPPFSAAILTPTNAWSVGFSDGARIVYAGSDPATGRGVVIDSYDSYEAEGSQARVLAPEGVGEITLTSYSDTCMGLFFTARVQQHPHLEMFGEYDLVAQQIVMGEVEPPGGCSN